jgi:hypothetical protein
MASVRPVAQRVDVDPCQRHTRPEVAHHRGDASERRADSRGAHRLLRVVEVVVQRVRAAIGAGEVGVAGGGIGAGFGDGAESAARLQVGTTSPPCVPQRKDFEHVPANSIV